MKNIRWKVITYLAGNGNALYVYMSYNYVFRN